MSDVILTVYNDTGDAAILDLFPEQSISLSFRFTDIANFAVQGGFSREFRLPATDNNVAFFGPIFNVNISGWFDFRKKVAAVLTVDTVPISTGHIQMKKVFTRLEQIHEFEIVFYAETPDLAAAVGDKKLSDLDTSALNHEVIFDEVTTAPDDRGWFLCDRGQRFSEEGQIGTRPIYSEDLPLYAGDLTPAVRAKYLLDTIMTEAGFVWEGWDGSTSLATRLSLYYMPYLNDRYIKYPSSGDGYLYELGYTSDQTGLSANANTDVLTGFTERFDNGSAVASDIFTAPFTGYFRFKAWITLRKTNGNGQADHIQIRLTDPDNSNAARWSSYQWAVISTGTDYNFATPEVQLFLNSGDRVQMSLWGAVFTFTLRGESDYNPQLGTGWRLVSTSEPLAGETIDYAMNAPDYKQIDFIRDIIKMHNCVVIPDRNIPNKIYIEPMETFIGTGASKDWTTKVDTEKDIVVMPTTDYQSKTNTWTYKAGEDAGSQLYVKKGRVYGDYKVEGYKVSPSDTPNDFAQGENKVELTLSSNPCNAIAGTNVIIPKWLDEDGEFVNPGPRLLFNAGTASAVQLYDDGGAGATPTDIPVLNHYSAVNPDLTDEDLNFAPEAPLQIITANPYNNLFNRYWRRSMNEIYSSQARVMIAYVDLNLLDITTFTFADKIWIKDANWRIYEISGYNVGGEDTVQVTFIKILSSQLDCPYVPYTVSTGGIVTFQDGNGDTSFGSQDCCSRYGYFWDADLGRCFAFENLVGGGHIVNPGLDGFGAGQSSTIQSQYAAMLGSYLNIDPATVFSYIAGTNISVRGDNQNTLAVGDTLFLDANHRGAALLGKSVHATEPGLHLGGGWYGDDKSQAVGTTQTGIVLMSAQGDFTTSTTDIELLIEGISGKRFNIDNRVTRLCLIHVVVHQYNVAGGTITGTNYGLFSVRLSKSGSTAAASTVNTIYQDGALGALSINIDTATDTTQHRINVRSNGGNPINTCKITATIQYTQIRT